MENTSSTPLYLPHVIFNPHPSHFLPHPPSLPLPYSDSVDMDIDPIFNHFNNNDVNDDVTFITNLFNRSHSHSPDNNPSLHLSLAPPHSDPVPADVNLELGLGLGLGFHPHACHSTTSTSASHSDSRLLGLGLGLGSAFDTDPTTYLGLRVAGLDANSDSESGSDSNSDSDVIDAGLGAVTDFDQPPFSWDYLGFNNHVNVNNGFIHHSSVESPGSHFVNHCIGFDDHYHGVESHTHTTHPDVIDDSFLFTHIHNHHYHHDAVLDDGSTVFPLDRNNEVEREVRQVSRLFDTFQQRATEHEVMIPSDTDDAADFDVDDAIRDMEWEILVAVNNFNREVYEMDFNADMYDAVLTEAHEHDDDSPTDGLPAADSAIQNLSIVRLSAESLKEKHGACAICKDDFTGQEELRQLPCSHYYHGNCIVPWLKIRNTCPVCRYELPTEDPNCEDYKRERQGSSTTTTIGGDVAANSHAGLDFHVFL